MARRAKRRSPKLMEMDHVRSANLRDRRALRKELASALEGAPEGLVTQVARAATLSGPEAQRMLEMAAQSSDAIGREQVERARDTIERFSVTP